jgi:hypothetical protein
MVQARMKVSGITAPYDGAREVTLNAVYSSDKNDPNFSFSQATPAASLKMTITNPNAFNAFEIGATYDLTFNQI